MRLRFKVLLLDKKAALKNKVFSHKFAADRKCNGVIELNEIIAMTLSLFYLNQQLQHAKLELLVLFAVSL